MRYKTAFRLGLKLIGVWMIASAVGDAGSVIGVCFELATSGQIVGNWMLGPLLGVSGQVAVGLYLFFGGRWIVDKAIPSNRPYCHECGYELSGAAPAEGVCPECGTEYRRPPRQSDRTG